ncbi:MAG: ribbon-helix-helix protein, CopG family, partial [Pseudonocardia sp.]|nr:ribbon-helix-helix protein, CopG family [Pseudonocardia sp.]
STGETLPSCDDVRPSLPCAPMASWRDWKGERQIMIDPNEYVMSEDDVISDVDLDTEVVRLKDGRRLTNELAEQLAEETLADARRRNLVPGRKSLSGGTVHSPRVQFRVPDSLRAAAEQRAAEKGVSLSELAREALEHYLAS